MYYLILCGYYVAAIMFSIVFISKEGSSFIELLENSVLFIDSNRTVFFVLLSMFSVITYYYFVVKKKDKLLFQKSRTRKIKRNVALSLFVLGLSSSVIVNSIYYLCLNNTSEYSMSLSFIESIVYFVGIVLLVPIIEELLFRKVMLMGLKDITNSRVAIIISSICFGLIHGNTFDFIYAFLMGIQFGIIYLILGNIIYPLMMHIGFNIIAIFVQIIEIPSSVNLIGIIVLGILACIFIWKVVILKEWRNMSSEIHSF